MHPAVIGRVLDDLEVQVDRRRRAAEIVRHVADQVARLDTLAGGHREALHVEVHVIVDRPFGPQFDRIRTDRGNDPVLDRDDFVQAAGVSRLAAQRLAIGRRADADVLALVDLGHRAEGRRAVGRARLAEIVPPRRSKVARVALVAAGHTAAERKHLRLQHRRRRLDRENHVGSMHDLIGESAARPRQQRARLVIAEHRRHRLGLGFRIGHHDRRLGLRLHRCLVHRHVDRRRCCLLGGIHRIRLRRRPVRRRARLNGRLPNRRFALWRFDWRFEFVVVHHRRRRAGRAGRCFRRRLGDGGFRPAISGKAHEVAGSDRGQKQRGGRCGQYVSHQRVPEIARSRANATASSSVMQAGLPFTSSLHSNSTR